MIVVTYWTNNQCRVLADRLGESAMDLGLAFEAVQRPHLSTWTENVNQKPGVIAEALERHQDDVLYVDADALILRQPTALASVDRPGAAFYPEPGKPAGGTLFFRNTREAWRLIHLWQKNVDRRPDGSDDFVNLTGALRQLSIKLAHLEPSYCWHEKNMRPRFPGAVPVIAHMCVGEHNYKDGGR